MNNLFFSRRSFVTGSVLGSCFSESFGGECSGTPERCLECKGVCQEGKGEKDIVRPALK